MRIMRRRMGGWLLAPSLMLAAWGCGGSGSAPSVSTSKAEATVKGTVMVKGKLATSGEVTFDPSNSERKDVGSVKAPIGKDGTYEIKTLVGANRVSVGGAELHKTAPEVETERLNFEVSSGDNTFNIELPRKR